MDHYPMDAPRRTNMHPSLLTPQVLVDEPNTYGDQLSMSTTALFPNYSNSMYHPTTYPLPSHSQSYQTMSPPTPIDRWVNQRADEPWSVSRSTTNNLTPSSYIGTSFTKLRSKAGSDTESVITTHTTPPTAVSVYSTEETVTNNQDSLQIQPEMANMGLNRRRAGSRASSTLDVPVLAKRSGNTQKTKSVNMRCEYCGQDCKTMSELK